MDSEQPLPAFFFWNYGLKKTLWLKTLWLEI